MNWNIMKTTSFRFSLRTKSSDDSFLASFRGELLRIKGIADIKFEPNSPFIDMVVQATFENSAQAKKLHTKLMRTMMKSDDITIAKAISNLTDVFE
jgi:hypothetical protein